MDDATAAWDAEATIVRSQIDGGTRRIRITRWHSTGCPNRGGHLAWTEAAAVSISTFPRGVEWPVTHTAG